MVSVVIGIQIVLQVDYGVIVLSPPRVLVNNDGLTSD